MNLKSYLIPIFVLAVFVFLSGFGSAATCNGSNNVINSTTISNGCTLNTAGTYNFATGVYNLNTSATVLQFSVPNIVLEMNGSTLFGNASGEDNKGLFSNVNNITIKNGIVYGYFKPIAFSDNQNLSVINMTIHGTNASGSSGGVQLVRTKNVLVLNSNFLNTTFLRHGIYCSGGCSNLTVINNYFDHNTIAIRIGNINDTYFYGNNFTYNTIGILTEGISNNTNIINNSFFSDKEGVRLTTSNYNYILNNYFTNISTTYALPITSSNYTFIKNNDFLNSEPIDIKTQPFKNIEISNNRFIGYYNVSWESIRVEAPNSKKDNLNISFNNFTNTAYGTIFLSYGNYSNLTIYSNRFYNGSVSSSLPGDFINLNGADGDGLISNNLFNLTSIAVLLSGSWTAKNYSMSTIVQNNVFDDMSGNGDSYNVGIALVHASNINLLNNSFSRIGCVGILSQETNNLSIINNSFSFSQSANLNKKSNCAYEVPTAIDLASIWKTWLSDASETINDNVTKILRYSSSNVNILNNSFLDFPVKLRASATINLTQDLSNYWFRSFASPDYLISKQDYYIDNSFNNLTTTFNETNNNPVIARDILGVGYMGSTSTIKMQFKVYNNYFYFQNINLTQNYTTALYNQTNSLIYFSNGSVACSNIATCDNNINITLTPNNYSYVLDNFNVTEGVTRQFSPISVSGSSTSKTITSQLSQAINATVVVNVAQCSFSATYQSNGIEEDSCSDNVATFTLTDIPAGESDLVLSYLDINCSSNTGASVIIILVFFALSIVALTFILIVKFREGEFDAKILIIVFIAIIVGLVLFTQVAQLTGGVCS